VSPSGRAHGCLRVQVFASFDAQSDMQLIDIGSAKLGSSAPEMYDLWKPVERMHERRDRALFLYRQRPHEHSERFGRPSSEGPFPRASRLSAPRRHFRCVMLSDRFGIGVVQQL